MISAPPEYIAANTLVSEPVVALEIDGYAKVFTTLDDGVDGHYPWISSSGNNSGGISDLSYNVSELDGSASVDDLTVSVVDIGQGLTADLASNILEGKVATLKTGFIGLDYSKWIVLFVGRVDSVEETPGAVNTSYDIVLKDTRIDLSAVIYQTGDSGQPTDSSNPKTVEDNPIDIVLSVLEDYCGIDPSLIDIATFEAYRDTEFAGSTMLFKITSPPDAQSFLEGQIFKPLGGYLRTNNLGQLTPVFFVPLPGTVAAVDTIDHDSLVLSQSSNASAGSGVPEVQQSPLTNTISFRYDKDDTGASGDSSLAIPNSNGYLSETVFTDDLSVAKYGLQGQLIIEADGVRSGFQGWLLGAFTSALVFGRYGDKNPTADVCAIWQKILLEAGDLVYVTSALMPNRATGMLGVTDALFQVSNRTVHFDDYTVEFTLMDASYMLKFGNFRYAPDSVPAWTAATTDQKARYMFVSDDSGVYSDDSPGHNTA